MRELVFGTILVAAAGAGVYFMPIGAAGGSGWPIAMTREGRETRCWPMRICARASSRSAGWT